MAVKVFYKIRGGGEKKPLFEKFLESIYNLQGLSTSLGTIYILLESVLCTKFISCCLNIREKLETYNLEKVAK